MSETETKILLSIFAVVPALIWLKFYLSKDDHPEPPIYLFLTFLGGAGFLFIGRIFYYAYGEMCKYFFGFELSVNFETVGIFGVALLATLEEILKYIPVRIMDIKSKVLDEPVDMIIYMVTSALGFAATENIGYVIRQFQFEGIHSAVGLNILRSFTSVVLHALASGIFGYILAFEFLKGKKRLIIWLSGLFMAALLHTIFNYFIISIGDGILVLILLLFSSFFLLEAIQYLKNLNINYIIKE